MTRTSSSKAVADATQVESEGQLMQLFGASRIGKFFCKREGLRLIPSAALGVIYPDD